MAKKNKTREEKILADRRHFTYHLESAGPQISLPSAKIPQPPANSKIIPSSDYNYVINDIKKTALITGAIVLAQAVLFFLIHRI